MAIQNKLFNTPTGRTYEVAPQIERGFSRLQGQVEGAMKRDYLIAKEQEEAFSQLYNNLGEIEGRLQENYRGIMQNAVDSTREYMKQHYMQGGKTTDPEFQARLGQMTGRIKAGMSNADNIRQQLKSGMELLKDDPDITPENKLKAVSEYLQMANNPDVLISRDPLDFSRINEKYVSSDSIFKRSYQALPSLGEVQSVFNDPSGNEMLRSVVLNPLIDSGKPVDEAGNVNLNITPEKTSEILRDNPRLLAATEAIRKERYGNEPIDIGLSKALRDGFGSVAGVSQKVSLRKTARDIEKENNALRLQEANISKSNALTDLNIAKARKELADLAETEEQQNAVVSRYNDFNAAVQSGDVGFLGEYENQKTGFKNFRYVLEDENNPEYQLTQSYNAWKSATKEDRIAVLEKLGIEVPTNWGLTKSDSEEAFKAAAAKAGKPSGAVIGVAYDEKVGSSEGRPNYETTEIMLNTEDDVINAFRTLENLRRSGTKFKPENELPQTENTPSFRNVPKGGF